VLQITNSATGRKEPLRPRTPGKLSLYVCGVTVYDDCHVGHARSAIFFDVVRRYLKHKGFELNYVKNYTDIDDKIIARAKREGTHWQDISARFTAAYERDMARLGVIPPSLAPKASAHIPEITEMIKRLISRGMAYALDGDVYFEVESFSDYGKLSHRKREDMRSGARVTVDARKRSPLDFALWKTARPGEPAWASPWGPGRPGWHIECSAMALKHLGEHIDLHGGGEDLIFPHHENEIAQSEGASGKAFVSCWMHHSFVTVDQEKMSKSLGNFFTIDEIFKKSCKLPEPVTAEVLRFYLLSTHYRSPVNFSDAGLKAAKQGLDKFYTLFQKLEEGAAGRTRSEDAPAETQAGRWESIQGSFEAAMDDDLNTPKAISILHLLRSESNQVLKTGRRSEAVSAANELKSLGKLLGLFSVAPEAWRFQAWDLGMKTSSLLDNAAVQRRVAARERARRARDWVTSDAIRDELARAGIQVEDRPDGSTRIRR